MARHTLLLCFILAFSGLTSTVHAQTKSAPPPNEAVGWVTSLSGKAYGLSGAEKTPLKAGQEVFNGMTILTEAQSGVRILFKGNHVLTISQNSKLTISKYLSTPQKTVSSFDLLFGRVRAAVLTRLEARLGDRFEIRTGNAVAGIRGSLLGVAYDPEANSTQAGCGEGDCYLNSGDQSKTIPPHMLLTVTGDQFSTPEPLKEGDPGFYQANEQYDGDTGTQDSPADETIAGKEESAAKGPSFQETPQVDYDPLTLDTPGEMMNPYDMLHGGTPGEQMCCGGTTQGPGEGDGP